MDQIPRAELLNKGVVSGYQPYRRSSRCEQAASAYIQQFGPGLRSLRNDLDPNTFSSHYSLDEIEDANTKLAEKRTKQSGDKTEHGQEAEVVFLQLLRDHKLLGRDARIIPTSEYDDEFPGVDFVIELPWRDGDVLRLGIDTTTTEDKEKIAQKERGGLQNNIDSDGDPFSYCDGAVRKARFFRSDTYSGIFSANNKKKRGILVPLVVVQLTRKEIDTYLIGIYDKDAHTLCLPRRCADKKEVVESGVLVLQRILIGITAQMRRLGRKNPLALFPEERILNKEMTFQLQKIEKIIKHSLTAYQHEHPEPMSDDELGKHYEDAHNALLSIRDVHRTYPSLIRDIKRKNKNISISLKSLYQAYKKDDLSAFDVFLKVLRDAPGSSILLNDMPFGEKTTKIQKQKQEEYNRHFAFLAGFQDDERFKQRLNTGDKTSQHINRAINRVTAHREFF